MRRVILPQAVRIVIPAIGNDFISMIKDSALVSYITIEELFWRADERRQPDVPHLRGPPPRRDRLLDAHHRLQFLPGTAGEAARRKRRAAVSAAGPDATGPGTASAARPMSTRSPSPATSSRRAPRRSSGSRGSRSTSATTTSSAAAPWRSIRARRSASSAGRGAASRRSSAARTSSRSRRSARSRSTDCGSKPTRSTAGTAPTASRSARSASGPRWCSRSSTCSPTSG